MWVSFDQVSAQALWGGTIVWVLVVLTAALNAPSASRLGGARGHEYFGGTLLLWMLWQINASVAPGLGYHVLGAALWVLMFGWPLATLSLSVVLGAELVVHGMGAAGGLGLEFSVRILPAILAPVCTLTFIRRCLPHHPFVYLLGAGFFGGVASAGAGAICAALAWWALGAYTWAEVVDMQLVYVPLMMYAEGFITGTCVTALAVFRPQSLQSFTGGYRFLPDR